MKLLDRIKNTFQISKESRKLDDDDILEWLGIKRTSKKNINEVTYYTCLKMLSETIGKLPIKYYEETADGQIRAESDELYKTVAKRPNRISTPSTFWSTVEFNTQHYGNGYVWIRDKFIKQKYGGIYKILDLWVLPTPDVSIIADDKGVFGDKGKLYYQYMDRQSGETYLFKNDNIMHFKTWLSLDGGITGEPVRKILEHTISGSLESQTFMNNLYKQGLTASMAMQYTGELEEGKLKKLQNKYEKYLTGSRNAGKIVPIPIGLTLTPLKMNLTDAQFFELRKYSALQIAGAFGIKPNQINNYEKSSYSNSETQQLAFLVDTMSARIKMYEEEINYKLIDCRFKNSNKFFKFNEKAILRADSLTQMQCLTQAVNNGLYSVNEGRAYLDLPSKEGGDILMVNGNYIPITSVGKQYEKERLNTDG